MRSNANLEVPNTPPGRFDILSSKEFDAAEYPRSWLVDELLVTGQPAVLGGPHKHLKTSVMVDLAVSLSTRTPFLGRFPVPARRRVLVYSGEGDPGGLRDTARRVARAHGRTLAKAGVSWCHDLPRLYAEDDLAAVRKRLAADKVDVVFFDPLYLGLLPPSQADLAANLYAVGPILKRAAGACLAAGATPVFVHHINKWVAPSAWGPDRAPVLEDLAYAGVREFARQWLLLGPGKSTESGRRLVVAAGGGAGQSGQWDVTIDEGRPGADLTGRVWHVTVANREGPGTGRPRRPGGRRIVTKPVSDDAETVEA